MTNNSNHTCAQFADKAQKLGFNLTEENIINSGLATAKYLKKLNFNKKVYVIGRTGLVDELEKLNLICTPSDTPIKTHYYDVNSTNLNLDPDVGAVVVNYDENFNYAQLLKAANYLNNPDCLFLTTCMDERIPSAENVIIPAIAPTVRAIEACTYRSVINMGKPSSNICGSLVDDGSITPKRTLMIGDFAMTDVLLGKNCGFQTMMVGSGMHNWNDIQRWKSSEIPDDKKLIPDTYLAKLGDLTQFFI